MTGKLYIHIGAQNKAIRFVNKEEKVLYDKSLELFKSMIKFI